MGIDLESKRMKAEGPVGIKPRGFIIDVVLDIMKKYEHDYTKEMVVNVFKEVDIYSKTQLKKIVKALPDVERVLKELNDRGVKIGIATTDLTERAVLAMESLELDEYFDEIVGADLVENAKPSADLVLYFLKKYNLNKREVIVIGDSMADLGMAKSALCQFIAVKTGLHNEMFLENSQFLIETLKELKVER